MRKIMGLGTIRSVSASLAALLAASPIFAQDLAITDVTTVDTRTGSLKTHQTVLIHEGRIVSIGSDPPPSTAVSLPARGKFLIPGLWDMVTHLSWTRASALPTLVANGITAVRDEGGDFAETAAWSEAVAQGRMIGPTIFQSGPMLNGKSFNRYQYALGTPEQARGAVRLLAFQGVDGLEIERKVPRDTYFALMAEANAAKLPVGGKVPVDIAPAEASDAGQTTIDNLETIYDGVFAAAHSQDLTAGVDAFLKPGAEGDLLFAKFARNGTAITPSLSAVAYAVAHNDPAARPDPNYRFVARSQRRPAKPMTPDELAQLRNMLPRLLTTTLRLQRAHVTLLAGTDIAGDRIPGFSLHDEFDLLAKAGLSPLEVLQAATLNAAKVMHRTDDYGTVEQGKIADLVILDGDPTRSIAALHSVNTVILHGRLLEKTERDDQLQQAIAMADRD